MTALALPAGVTPARLRAAYEAADGEQRARLAALLGEWEAAQNQRQFWTYFPDEGPLRRELYPKHMAFFEASAYADEILFLAGNRCITPWTAFEKGRATRRVDEVLGEQAFDVLSWDGDSRCTRRAGPVVLRGIEPAFRVHLGNGQWFDCSRRHRVLTDAGWLSLGQLVRRAGGLHWSRTPPGSTASCGEGGCPDDSQPRPVRGSDRASPLPPSDALEHCRSTALLADASARRRRYSHALPVGDRRAIRDEHDQIVDLCARFRDPGGEHDARWPTATRQALRQLAAECGRLLAETACAPRPPSGGAFAPAGSFDTAGTTALLSVAGRDAPRSAHWKDPGRAWSGFDRGAQRTEMFVPFDGPRLLGGVEIECIAQLGYQPILDFPVDGTRCYFAGGVIHHNTGKTESGGGYATVCHLTGRYPEWWPGRRFKGPIQAWCAGDTIETTRDIQQTKLLGPAHAWGTGVLPGEDIGEIRLRRGVENAVASVRVRHVSGGWSTLGFKSYDQGRRTFQGTERHLIWLDEECPLSVYEECITRTMATPRFEGGLVMLTFTPLKGLSEVVLHFLPSGRIEEAA